MSEENTSAANEPVVPYGKVRIFHSFKEMNEADAKEMAQFSPEEHLKHATEVISGIYGSELQKPFSDFTIHFK